MKINYKGQEIEAYALLMRKENALAILNGTKTLETRMLSRKYEKMFYDEEKAKQNEIAEAEGRPDDWHMPVRTDIGVIHFYSTGAPWTLDVAIDEIGVAACTKEDIRMLQEDYNFHEFDYGYNDMPESIEDDENAPLFYYIHISEILQSSGLGRDH